MSKEMSEEAFNEIVDGFEYIRTLTEWGSKNIKQHIQRLQQENERQKEIIDKIVNLIKQYGKYDGKKCTRGFQMWSADFNKILDILKEVSK